MNYEEALGYIHGTLKFGSKLGLHNITHLLELLGRPQDSIKFVHVAGTNGKGSTSSYISSILREAGYCTGLFTSPYIQRFTERIKVDGQEIGPVDLAEVCGLVKDKIEVMLEQGENHPTEFEIVTAIAMLYFKFKECDFVVLEVGLGGRYDSTNVISVPELAVITTISLDHTDILGDTLGKIAYEKAGIIKPGGLVLSYPQDIEAQAVIKQVCEQQNAVLNVADFSNLHLQKYGIDGQSFSFDGLNKLGTTLLGEHQLKNAAMAIIAARLLDKRGFPIKEEAIRKGIGNAKWPGRLEVLQEKPVLIIDGAHNLEGAIILKKSLDKYFPTQQVTFIFGVLRDKQYNEMIQAVMPGCKKIFAITPESERALPAEQLAVELRPYCNDVIISDTIEDAVRAALESTKPDEIICAFGSLYYIGRVRDYFRL